jgi:hypothetical protein
LTAVFISIKPAYNLRPEIHSALGFDQVVFF